MRAFRRGPLIGLALLGLLLSACIPQPRRAGGPQDTGAPGVSHVITGLDQHWTKADNKDCGGYRTLADVGDIMVWNGDCEDGLISGPGQQMWLTAKTPGGKYEAQNVTAIITGTFDHGRLQGPARVATPTGFFNGSWDKGVLVAANGTPIQPSPAPPPQTPTGPGMSTPGIADLPQLAALRTAPRFALVMGNDHYRNSSWPSLQLAQADAGAIGSSLSARGFTLIGGGVQRDVTAQRLRQLVAMTETASRAQPGAIIVIYYAGHGFAAGGHNYLVPTDAPAADNASSSSVSVLDLAQRMHESGSGITAMFLDACRAYEGGDGLVDETVPDSTFVGFATQFGSSANEPVNGAHGYYTAALLDSLDRGFGHFDDMHLAVAMSVARATQIAQIPVYRQGTSMPGTPVRLSLGDPQTDLRLAIAHGAPNAEIIADRCAALADLRLVFNKPPEDNKNPFLWGPEYDVGDFERIRKDCDMAYDMGRRDPAVLRGKALAQLLGFRFQAPMVSSDKAAEAVALLTEAGEAGDADSNFWLGMFVRQSPSRELLGLSGKSKLIEAAKQAGRGQSLIPTMVALQLWNPREKITPTKQDDAEEGIRIFQKAVADGDPYAVTLASTLRDVNPDVIRNVDWREAFRRAISNGSEFGQYVPGTSVHETLFLVAFLRASRDHDWLEYANLMMEASPTLDKTFLAYNKSGDHKPIPIDQMYAIAGCLIGSGKDFNGNSIEGLVPNRELAFVFLRRAADAGLPDGYKNIAEYEHKEIDCKMHS